MTSAAQRPWRDIARELVNETDPLKARKLMGELSEAFEEQKHLDGLVLTINRPDWREH